MNRYRLTPLAQRDLSGIWDFTLKRWGESQAETYIKELRLAIERIAEVPGRGRRCEEIRAGNRRYGIGSHLIFFVESKHGIDVIRILHQRMDPTRHF